MRDVSVASVMCFDTVMVCRPGELEQEASFITQRLVVFRSAAGDSAQRLPRSLTCEARIRSANACCCASSGLIFWRSMVSRPLRNSGIDRGRAFCGVYDVPSYHLAGHRAAALTIQALRCELRGLHLSSGTTLLLLFASHARGT